MPNNPLTKIINIIFLVIVGVSLLSVILYYAGGVTPESLGTAYEEKNYTEVFLIWAYVLGITGIILAIGFPIIRSISNPKNLNRILVILAFFVVVFIVSYLMASDKPMDITGLGLVDNPLKLKFSDMMLFAVYILFGTSIIAILYSGVAKFFK